MPLDWDVKFNAVSIRDQIVSFTIRESKGMYVRELTLVSADPAFYTQFSYSDLPTATVEVLTKTGVDWVSQGEFYIEKPVIAANEDGTTSPGVWGRSGSAKTGQPFAQKISKYWERDTTFNSVVNEMAVLCGITITLEVDDYNIVANTYVVDNLYPIDVITELADFIGAYVSCTNDGNLVIKEDTFHPLVATHTVTDDDIVDVSENQELPDFGNRIRISALGGVGFGYNVDLEAVDDSDCLPADGTSVGTLLAFVRDSENNPAPENTMVTWEAGEGVTLASPTSATQNYLLVGRKHQADNFYEVSVDYPIHSVIGIWAYSDSGNNDNFWEEVYGSFEGSTITVRSPFAFCDQTLRITYITEGCAVNRVTAGLLAKDVEITADVEGAADTLTMKLGNTCACGSSLNMRANPSGDVCLGNLGHILVWATVSKIPATGQMVKIRITKGCGVLSSENKKLKNVDIRGEASYTENVILGTTQVSTEIDISDVQTPSVYLSTDTSRSNDLYSSHSGKIIELNAVLETGLEVIVDYHAEGATLISWRTLGETKDCDSEVTVSMSNGTEVGLISEISMSATDCSITSEIPEDNEDWDEYDPDNNDYNDDDSGGFEDDGNTAPSGPSGGLVDPCFTTIMGRILNAENATNDDELNATRFGVSSEADCPEEDFECLCSELCTSEVYEKGNTYDETETIHEVVSQTYEKGTPEYNEEFQSVMDTNIAACSETCESKRQEVCNGCEYVSGPEVLAPEESAEYVCSDGATVLVTMPSGHCGVYTATVGCCSIDIRSTLGSWVLIYRESYGGCFSQGSSLICQDQNEPTYESSGVPTKYEKWSTICAYTCSDDETDPNPRYIPCEGEESCNHGSDTRQGLTYAEYEWQC